MADTYYFVTIQTFVDGSPTAKAIYDYSDYDTALSALFSTMVSSMANTNIKHVMCLIMNDGGQSIKYEQWDRPTAQQG